MPSTGPLITTAADLQSFCDALRGVKVLALDTEFIGENSYFPKLEILQIAADGQAAVVDYPAVRELGPLFEILYDPAVVKVFHAATQDIEILYHLSGRPLAPIFDTQVGAAFVGYGEMTSYTSLVERVTGKHLRKLHTTTDWSRRPLSASQLSYAIDDVTFLLPVYAHLVEQLERLGRLPWVQEECTSLEGVPVKLQTDDRERYMRVKEWNKLDRRGLALLRELAEWREATSRQRNMPRMRIVGDEVLVEIARVAPTRVAELRNLRRLYPRIIERDGEAIIAAVRRGLEVPDDALPKIERGRGLRIHPGVVELLNAFLRARADEKDISPTQIATVRDLEVLAHNPRSEEARRLPVLHGWRRDMVGNEIIEILEGSASIRLDAKTGRVLTEKHSPQPPKS